MSALEKLCLSCGLCCDGSMFGNVAVTQDEAARLRVLGMAVIDGPNGGARFTQGCASLGADCRCRVYEARPVACRRFNCLVATALIEGEIDLTEAEQTVARARREVAEKGRELAEPFLKRHLLGRSSTGR